MNSLYDLNCTLRELDMLRALAAGPRNMAQICEALNSTRGAVYTLRIRLHNKGLLHGTFLGGESVMLSERGQEIVLEIRKMFDPSGLYSQERKERNAEEGD